MQIKQWNYESTCVVIRTTRNYENHISIGDAQCR